MTAGGRQNPGSWPSRLAVLAGVAGFVTVVYAVVVIGGAAVTGSRPPSLPLAVLATAIVAVTLEPVRQWLRRRFFGSAYDRLAAFGMEMAGSIPPEEVCPRMARLLAEATASRSVEIWLIDDERRENVAGRWPLDADLADRSLASVRVDDVVHAGELLGRVVRDEGEVGGLSPVEERLIADLLSQAGLALRHVSLTARLRQRIAESTTRAEQLRRSRQRVAATADAERARLERDIHDGAQQHLVALAVRIRLARTVVERQPHKVVDVLAGLRGAAHTALATLLELSQGVYPRALAESGVASALRAATDDSPVPVRISDQTARRLPPEAEAAAYFTCLEAVQNAVKHAAARVIEVRLVDEGQALRFAVQDDGRGLPAGAMPLGSGLASMRDRLDAAGGELTVLSRRGAGTIVRGRIPLAPAGGGTG